MLMLKLTISNTFLSQSKLLLLLVMIDNEIKYKISQIVDLKINYKKA